MKVTLSTMAPEVSTANINPITNRTSLADVLLGLLLTISLAMSAWTLVEVVQLKVDVAAIQASRYTLAKGEALTARVEEVAKMASDKEPSPWVVKKLEKLEDDLQAANNRLYQLVLKAEKLSKASLDATGASGG